MTRWKIWNCNYRPVQHSKSRLRRKEAIIPLPWLVTSTRGDSVLFATHAQALTYATSRIETP